MRWWDTSGNEELKRSTVVLIRTVLLVDPKVAICKLTKNCCVSKVRKKKFIGKCFLEIDAKILMMMFLVFVRGQIVKRDVQHLQCLATRPDCHTDFKGIENFGLVYLCGVC